MNTCISVFDRADVPAFSIIRVSALACALALFVSLTAIVGASAQSCPELTGLWPYSCAFDLALDGDHVYVTSFIGLVVLNVGDPENPTVAGKTILPDWAKWVEANSDFAFVSGYFPGLAVIDISDPTQPEVSGWYTPADESECGAMAVDGSYVYAISKGDPGIWILDVSDPAHTAEAGSET